MTTLGKLFVLLVFTLSIGFLAMAVSVYANHVAWKSASKDQPGPIDRLQEKITQLAFARDKAQERYNAAYSELGQVELTRTERQRFYAAKLEMLRTGKDDKGNVIRTPVYHITPPAGGLIPMRMLGTEAEIWKSTREEPLQSLVFYQQQQAARHKDILDEKTKVEQLQKDLTALTFEMQGGMREGRDVVGLIRLKEIQVDARTRAISEQEFLKPDLANRFSEAVIVLKRESELRRRLESLAKGDTARLEQDR